MNQGGTPAASSAPIIDPAEVPTMKSALRRVPARLAREGVEAAGEPGATEHTARAEYKPDLHAGADARGRGPGKTAG